MHLCFSAVDLLVGFLCLGCNNNDLPNLPDNALIIPKKVAFKIAKEELILYTVASGIVIYLAAVGMYYCERVAQPKVFASIPHALWWAVATLTTVGYGDIYPVTPIGKMLTTLILFVGLGMVAVPSGIIATALSEARNLLQDHDEGLARASEQEFIEDAEYKNT